MLLSYRTEPVRHRLAARPTQELKAITMAQIRQALPPALAPDGKRGSFAWTMAYRRYSNAYVAEEAEAATQRRGIWQGPVTPPWEHRRQRR